MAGTPGTRKRITSKGETRWQAWIDVGGRRKALGTYPTLGAARAARREEENRLARGQYIDPRAGAEHFDTFAESWLARRKGTVKPATYVNSELTVRLHLTPWFGDKRLNRITSEDVAEWFAQAPPDSRAVHYQILRALLNDAVAHNRLARNPCQVKGGGVVKAGERPLIPDDKIGALRQALPDRLQVVVTLAAFGGLRRGEILGLRRSDIDVKAGTIRIDRQQQILSNGTVTYPAPKSAAGRRTLAMSAAPMEAIKAHLERHVLPGDDALVVTGEQGGPLRPRSLYVPFEKARTAAKLPKEVTLHDLRHWHLTKYAAAGASLRDLMARAGHSNPTTCLTYLHTDADRDATLIAGMDSLYRA